MGKKQEVVAEPDVEVVEVPSADVSVYDGTSVSAREVPWMKIGKLVEQPMTAAEAAELGGLNFDVSFCPVEYAGSDGKRRKMTNRLVAERTDTHVPLGVVSTTYKPVQYGEAFSFMDAVNPHYVAAGALGGGRQGFMVVKFEGWEKLNLFAGQDPHDLFAVLRTSHDCSRAVEVAVMPLRGRCMNQLVLNDFATGAPRRWSFKHVGDVAGKMKEAEQSLAMFTNYTSGFAATAAQLADVHVPEEKAREILVKSLPNRPKRDEVVTAITGLWNASETVGPDFFGTGWGLVNAVSEYFDWYRRGGNPASRFTGALQGQTVRAVNNTARFVLAA